MSKNSIIHILWDDSHLWGLMAARALEALGLPWRLTKGEEIAEGLLLGKSLAQTGQDISAKAALLLVPGGNARLKAKALGPKGLEAIREYVQSGGAYLGLCGGAGLALTCPDKDQALNLCPWSRKPYPERLQHLASGHVKAYATSHPLCPTSLQNRAISLPIWWPGRFSPQDDDYVTVLARASCKDSDFWLGDLPLDTIPEDFLAVLQNEYGLDLSSEFLRDMPLIITGNFGRGRYLLSYSHLETPNSSAANQWLSFLIKVLAKLAAKKSLIPSWDLKNLPRIWPSDPRFSPLEAAQKETQKLLNLGLAHHLFFTRTSWLFGWKSGLPGAALNSLHAALATLFSCQPTPAAFLTWAKREEQFRQTLKLFAASAEENLLTKRIASVLGNLMPHTVKHRDLKDRQELIFGQNRDGGGLLGMLLNTIEELIFQSQKIPNPR